MALAVRLRRAIVVTSSSALLLRPAASTTVSGPLSFSPFVLVPLPPRRLWLLPGAAAGFWSMAADEAAAAAYRKISPDEIPSNGYDYNHWLITMNFPDPEPPREKMIETYLQTLAKVVGSYEEAKRRMYAFSTTTYTGFQVRMTSEMAEKFYGLPGVANILPDGYLYPDRKQYGGDKYDNGVITPFRPRYYWGKSSRPDRNLTFQRNCQNSSFQNEVTLTDCHSKETSKDMAHSQE